MILFICNSFVIQINLIYKNWINILFPLSSVLFQSSVVPSYTRTFNLLCLILFFFGMNLKIIKETNLYVEIKLNFSNIRVYVYIYIFLSHPKVLSVGLRTRITKLNSIGVKPPKCIHQLVGLLNFQEFIAIRLPNSPIAWSYESN